MAQIDRNAAVEQLVLANHILASRGIVDGFGHVSIRDPEDPHAFLIARSMAPTLVRAEDIMRLDLEGRPLAEDARPPYLERFIHAEIYRARAPVMAVVHSHAASIIPFGVASYPLMPVFHMAAAIGANVPVFEIADTAGDASDLLVRTPALGQALATKLGDAAVVLMRGHGMTTVGEDLPEAVFRAVYAEENARLQQAAMFFDNVRYLSAAETVEAAAANRGQIGRAWDLWVAALRPSDS